MKAEHRLRRSDEFSSAVRRGAAARRASVVVHVAPGTDEDGPAKVGFVVGRAVGGAVVRNAVRRRLRHLMAARLPMLPSGATVVVRALPGAGLAARASLAADLDKALASALRRAQDQ
nr:ribonuclease P protein component [Phytoactinopolyspora alkaliphila]